MGIETFQINDSRKNAQIRTFEFTFQYIDLGLMFGQTFVPLFFLIDRLHLGQ